MNYADLEALAVEIVGEGGSIMMPFAQMDAPVEFPSRWTLAGRINYALDLAYQMGLRDEAEDRQ